MDRMDEAMITVHFVDGPLADTMRQWTKPDMIIVVLKPETVAWHTNMELPLPEFRRAQYRRVERVQQELNDYTYVYEGESR